MDSAHPGDRRRGRGGDEIYRHGLIHHATDAQKSYNYARSAMVEHIGNQPKAPWLVTAKQIQNYKAMWENANKGNPAALVYDADPAPKARRQPPPQCRSHGIRKRRSPIRT
jgi:hypothetical protein